MLTFSRIPHKQPLSRCPQPNLCCHQRRVGHIDIVHFRVGKTPSAARTFSVESIYHCREGGWVWEWTVRFIGR